jgi:D-xylose transport system substrate-binding protein
MGVVALAAALVLALAATASMGARSPQSAKAGPIVALLWPENVTPRWEGNDKPTLTKSLQQLIPGVQVDSLNALNNPTTQTNQAQAELAKGAKVLIVAAIDGKAFGAVAKQAAAQGAQVIAYDRLITGAPVAAYVSFDSVVVGKVEAGWMAKHTKKGDRLAIINGSTTDANAHFVNTGIHAVLDPLFKSGARVKVAEQWTPGWNPPDAQREMEQILTKTNNNVQGVVSANDGMAGGIIAALKAQGLQGKVPTTGQDASLEGIQNVIVGYQGVTAFKDFRLQAPAAARIAAALINGTKPLPGINGSISNGVMKVPAVYLPVVAVDKSNIGLLVRNGWIRSQYGGVSKVCKGLPKVSICR